MEFANFADRLNPSTMSDGVPSLNDIAGLKEREPGDISSDYKVGDLDLSGIKFLDLKYFKQGVEYFRPLIDAFLIFLCGLLYWRELMSWMGQASTISGSVGHTISHYATRDDKEKKD